MVTQEYRNLARDILSRSGARERVFNMDGSINRAALNAEIKRHQEVSELVPEMSVPSKVGRKKEKGWKPLKQPSPGRASGHRKHHR